jgi:hypothetical protein
MLRSKFWVTCDDCKKEFRVYVPCGKDISTKIGIWNLLKTKGWTGTSNKSGCPKCTAKKKSPAAKAAEVEKNRKEALENLAKYARIRQANAIRALSTNCGDENFLRIYPFPM